MRIQTELINCDDDTVKSGVEIEMGLEPARIALQVIDDHLLNDDGSITPASSPRSVITELRSDGVLQVLLYGTERDEPMMVHLTPKGEVVLVGENRGEPK